MNRSSNTSTMSNFVSNAPPSELATFLELESNSSLNRAITTLLKLNFFEQKPINWKPVKLELIVNTKLTDEFLQIKTEFQKNAEDLSESDEKYGFIIETDQNVNTIGQKGYSCIDNSFSVIGQSKAGVYICKYSDICLKFAEFKKWPDNLTLKMIIFKICLGKQTTAVVRKTTKLQPISPTPGFNSHCSGIPTKELEEIEVQFDQSQIYLYELNADKVPAKRPRHCLPYAVVTWLKFNDGTEWPHSFNEMEGDTTLLQFNTFQLALSTDDIYIKTKLKEILKTYEDTQKCESQNLLHDNTNNMCDTTPSTHINSNNENSTDIIQEVKNNILINDTSNNTEGQLDNEKDRCMTEIHKDVDNYSHEINNLSSTQEIKSPSIGQATFLISSATSQTENVSIGNLANNNIAAATTAAVTTTTTSAPINGISSLPNQSSNLNYNAIQYQHKTNFNHYQKSSNSSVYRQSIPLPPYIFAQNPTPYNNLRYVTAQSPQIGSPSHYFTSNHAYGNIAPQTLQQPLYLCRGPNGLTYFAAPSGNVLGSPAHHQNAYLQHAAQQSATSFTPAIPYKLPLSALQAFNHPSASQIPQPQQQIIYQAAPQPAQTSTSNANKNNLLAASNNGLVTTATVQQQSSQLIQTTVSNQQQPSNVAQGQVAVHVTPTQSPKQNSIPSTNQQTSSAQYAAASYVAPNHTAMYASQNQINQMQQQLAAAYQGQPTYLTYASNPSNLSTTLSGHTYYTNPTNYVVAQPGSTQQISTASQNNIYGFTTQVNNGFATQTQSNGQISMTLPAAGQHSGNYQLIDYRQMAGLSATPGTVQIDQFGQQSSSILQRPRIVNLRHHPYPRN